MIDHSTTHTPSYSTFSTLTAHHDTLVPPENCPSTIGSDQNISATQKNVWSTIGMAVRKVCAFPFRSASTLVSGALFAGYYVVTIAATGLAAAGGTVYGAAQIGKCHLCGERPQKTLAQYSIAPAKATFNFMSRLYYELPENTTEVLFAGLMVTVVAAGIVASLGHAPGLPNSDDISAGVACATLPNRLLSDDSVQKSSGTTEPGSNKGTFLSPYKVATDFGVSVMDKTKKFLT